jgi:hypothetical protein
LFRRGHCVLIMVFRDKYLPWLIYENELACLKVTFTVCDKEPVPLTDTDKQGWYC